MDEATRAKLARIAQIGARLGLNQEAIRAAQAVALTEGALSGQVGDNGLSWGPYQFHYRGQLPNYAKARGLSVDQAAKYARANFEDAVEWALSSYLGNAIRKGQASGLSGPQLATYAQQYGQVSVSPWKAGSNYQRLFKESGDDLVFRPGDTPTVEQPIWRPGDKTELQYMTIPDYDEWMAEQQQPKQQPAQPSGQGAYMTIPDYDEWMAEQQQAKQSSAQPGEQQPYMMIPDYEAAKPDAWAQVQEKMSDEWLY